MLIQNFVFVGANPLPELIQEVSVHRRAGLDKEIVEEEGLQDWDTHLCQGLVLALIIRKIFIYSVTICTVIKEMGLQNGDAFLLSSS